MRISSQDANFIKSTAQEVFGKESRVYLFGSRMNDDAKGGDIDLMVRTADTSNLLSRKLTFLADVKQRIGDQKIDLIIRPFKEPDKEDVIYQEALNGQML